MRRTPIRAGGAALLVLLAAGCAETTPRWDRSFGESVRVTIAAQMIKPGAAANSNPVAGVDGRAAAAAQERYEKSFAQPESAPMPALITTLGTAK